MAVGTIFENKKTKQNYVFFDNPNELKQFKVGKYYEIYIGGKFDLDMLNKCQTKEVMCGFVDSLTGTVVSMVHLGLLLVGGGLIIYSLK